MLKKIEDCKLCPNHDSLETKDGNEYAKCNYKDPYDLPPMGVSTNYIMTSENKGTLWIKIDNFRGKKFVQYCPATLLKK